MATALAACPGIPFTCLASSDCTENDISWLKTLMADHEQARLCTAMNMPENEVSDVVLVSGKGDGDSLYTALEKYTEKGRWLVINGGLSTAEDMSAMGHWLRKYRALIDHSMLLPTRSGIMIVKMRYEPKQTAPMIGEAYKELESSYTSEYFLTDCGGYIEFRMTAGQELLDPRHMGVIRLAMPRTGQRILDVGCGRGELAFALAQAGAEVVAIDYSGEAIALAQTTYSDQKVCKSGLLTFVQKDILQCTFDQPFDVIVTADFIEHIDAAIADTVVGRLQEFLKPDGICIMHTAPNLLYYKYAYGEKRSMARQAGSYLPPNPRTFYEQRTHINEQTPSRLNRLMHRHFKCVHTWATQMPDIGGTLKNGLSRHALKHTLSLYSIGSQSNVTRQEILERIGCGENISPLESMDKSGGTDQLSRVHQLLYEAEIFSDAGSQVTPMVHFHGVTRKLALLAGKMVVYLSSFITFRQRTFNKATIGAIRELTKAVEETLKATEEKRHGNN
jgi:2-polyprenyl-3-methyl-5-hydroxy-6-metoxy-1,4-benzoquinol methylase